MTILNLSLKKDRVYTREELVKMKRNNKERIRFNAVDSITVKNTPDNIVIMSKLKVLLAKQLKTNNHLDHYMGNSKHSQLI